MRELFLVFICIIFIGTPINAAFTASWSSANSQNDGNTASLRNGQDDGSGRRSARQGTKQQVAPPTAIGTTIEVSIQESNSRTENKTATNEASVDRHAHRSFAIYCGLAAVLFSIMFGLSHVRPEYLDDFLENNGLRYIALVLILAAVALFGLLRIIEGKDVTVLLSAIAGYILGADGGALCRRHMRNDDRGPAPDGGAPKTSSNCPTAPATPAPVG
jgi:hypothetical protein